jgi:two-component system, cell cycle response regulator DivK
MANELILIVEDDEKNRKLARDVLRVKGYRTLEAESAEAALVAVQETVPNLILMDIQLPGMNGIEALKRLRQRESTRAVPVLAFTASIMPKDRTQITAAGFDGFIAKPIKLKEFEATIAQALRKGAA